jgi:hypothetical protein
VILCTAAVLAGLPPELLRPTLEALIGMYSALLVAAADLEAAKSDRSCGCSSSSSRLAGREAEPEADKAFEELAEAIASSGPTPSKCGRCRICCRCLICRGHAVDLCGPARCCSSATAMHQRPGNGGHEKTLAAIKTYGQITARVDHESGGIWPMLDSRASQQWCEQRGSAPCSRTRR